MCFIFYFLLIVFIYLFWAVLGLWHHVSFSLVAGEPGLLFVAVRGLLAALASLAEVYGL